MTQKLASFGVLALIASLLGFSAAQNNCTLLVPANPLSAQGLATPYQISGDGCQMNTNPTFAQGAILDPTTGSISVYNPLVIDQGSQPAVVPTPPTLPRGAVIAVWIGSNANVVQLQGPGVQQGNCIDGVPGSPFGQVSACGAVAFFAAANNAIRQGRLRIPQLGMAKDGKPCPTTRDFSVVDQDPSDNVNTQYLLTADGTQTAQKTQANVANLTGATVIDNGSDNALLDSFIDPALGCTPFQVPDLADPGSMVSAQPLNELVAAARQQAPIALVEAGDPMLLDGNGNPDLTKLNAYRSIVDQPQVASLNQASTATFCQNLLSVGVPRLKNQQQFTQQGPTPDPAVGNNLFTFLAARFEATFVMNLACTTLLNVTSPVNVTLDGNGVAINATYTVTPTRPRFGAPPTPTQTTRARHYEHGFLDSGPAQRRRR